MEAVVTSASRETAWIGIGRESLFGKCPRPCELKTNLSNMPMSLFTFLGYIPSDIVYRL